MENQNEAVIMPQEKDYTKEIAFLIGAGILLIAIIILIAGSGKGKIGMAEVMAQLEG